MAIDGFKIGTTTYKASETALTSGSATDGQVLTADGNGGCAWEDASGGTTLNQYDISFSATTSGITSAVLTRIINIWKTAKGRVLICTNSYGAFFYTPNFIGTAGIRMQGCQLGSSNASITYYDITDSYSKQSFANVTYGNSPIVTATTNLTGTMILRYFNDTEITA